MQHWLRRMCCRILRCSVGRTVSDFGMVNIYKGLTLQLIIGSCLNAVFICLIISTQYSSTKYHYLILYLFSSITYKRWWGIWKLKARCNCDTHASFESGFRNNNNVQNNNYSFIKIHPLSRSTSFLYFEQAPLLSSFNLFVFFFALHR